MIQREYPLSYLTLLLEIENGQTELDEEWIDGIEVNGSVNELDGEGKEMKGKDEGSDDHNWK